MGDYLARVELHGARSREDYDTLHDLLKRVGIYNSIVNSSQKALTLPTGTYVAYGKFGDVDSAHAAIRQAANGTGFGSTIVVVNFTWQGSAL